MSRALSSQIHENRIAVTQDLNERQICSFLNFLWYTARLQEVMFGTTRYPVPENRNCLCLSFFYYDIENIFKVNEHRC
jgi:hypothetical protein